MPKPPSSPTTKSEATPVNGVVPNSPSVPIPKGSAVLVAVTSVPPAVAALVWAKLVGLIVGTVANLVPPNPIVLLDFVPESITPLFLSLEMVEPVTRTLVFNSGLLVFISFTSSSSPARSPFSMPSRRA